MKMMHSQVHLNYLYIQYRLSNNCVHLGEVKTL